MRERLERVKDMLKIVGLSEGVYWVSWVITVSLPVLFVCVNTCVFGFGFGLWRHSNLLIVFLLCLAFGLSIIAFAVLMSVLVSTRPIAVLISMMWIYMIQQLVVIVNT